MQNGNTTKILFVEEDELTFEFKKCIAQALQKTDKLELLYAQDATEGLKLLEREQPDVIVLDDTLNEECELFLESLSALHPPIVLQIEGKQKTKVGKLENLNCVKKDESLNGIHSILMTATNIALRNNHTLAQ
jgi:DNA-binding NarL/FixJ family response regulator